MYKIFLKEEDLLKAEHFPVIALLNEASNPNVIEFVENLCEGIGTGYDFSSCSFWNDFDEYDQVNMEKFDGLLITNEAGDEIIISKQELKHYLEILYNRLSDEHFNNIHELRKLLDKFEVGI